MQKTQVQFFSLDMNNLLHQPQPYLYVDSKYKKFFICGMKATIYGGQNFYIPLECFFNKLEEVKSSLKVSVQGTIFKLQGIKSREDALILSIKKVFERACAAAGHESTRQSKYKEELESLWKECFPNEKFDEELTLSYSHESSFIEDSGLSEAEIAESFKET